MRVLPALRCSLALSRDWSAAWVAASNCASSLAALASRAAAARSAAARSAAALSAAPYHGIAAVQWLYLLWDVACGGPTYCAILMSRYILPGSTT